MPKTIDLTGLRFGKLVARDLMPPDGLGKGRSWRCDCDCGGSIVQRADFLKRGFNTSCGCGKRGPMPADLTGRRFGMLVAREIMPPDEKRQGRSWRCDCDCGRSIVARAKDLKDEGNTTSCGCRINRPVVTRPGEHSPRQVRILAEMVRQGGHLFQGDVGGILGVGNTAVVWNIERLVKDGLILVFQVPTGRCGGHRHLLTLTAKGWRLAQKESVPEVSASARQAHAELRRAA